MAGVTLYWDEVRQRNLPHVCMHCGEHDASWFPRRLSIFRYRVVYRYTEWIDLELPFCEAHAVAPFLGIGAPRASDLTRYNIRMTNVSPEFVAALEHRRETADRRWEHERRKRRFLGLPIRDAEGDSQNTSRRRTPSHALWIVLLVLGLTGGGLLGGLCCIGFAVPLLTGKRGIIQAGPNPAAFDPNPPGFGPRPAGGGAGAPKGGPHFGPKPGPRF